MCTSQIEKPQNCRNLFRKFGGSLGTKGNEGKWRKNSFPISVNKRKLQH